MSSRFPNNSHGFTLIEVLIAIFLLVVISMSIYQATTETYRLRDILVHEGDFYNTIRLSMEILQKDISVIYTPTLMAPPEKKAGTTGAEPPASARDLEAIMGEAGRTTPFWHGATDQTGIRASHFIGTDSKMSFISLSHIRIYKESRETEFAKITYEIKTGKHVEGIEGNLMLVKTESPNAFSADEFRDPFKRTYMLLRGIRSIRFQYYQKDKDRWHSRWDTESEDFKNKYPDAIEVRVEVTGPAKLSFEGLYRFKPEIPLSGKLNPST